MRLIICWWQCYTGNPYTPVIIIWSQCPYRWLWILEFSSRHTARQSSSRTLGRQWTHKYLNWGCMTDLMSDWPLRMHPRHWWGCVEKRSQRRQRVYDSAWSRRSSFLSHNSFTIWSFLGGLPNVALARCLINWVLQAASWVVCLGRLPN